VTTEPNLPKSIIWRERPFPNSNFLLLLGEQPSLIDSGFVAHAEHTANLTREFTTRLSWVANTHWHSDHVGANAILRQAGAQIAGSHSDAESLFRTDPGCCVAEYLDQPVPRYTVDNPVGTGDRMLLGDLQWEVLSVPGHTPGHLAFWNAEHRLAAVGDTVTAHDVGWVNVMREGTRALDAALNSLGRLQALDAQLLLPGHGPLVTDPSSAIDNAIGRLERQRSRIDLAISHSAKRVLAFALMIHGGMAASALDDYLTQCEWAQDAATVVDKTVAEFSRDLVDSMLRGGGLTLRAGTVYAAASSTPVDPEVFDLPFPRAWPQHPGQENRTGDRRHDPKDGHE